nr:hypothetical protein [Tanacetum cinerariifolium]
MVAASKVSMLKPGEFEIWRMRIEQYIQMVDYALWEVIENGVTLPKTQVVEGFTTMMPITSVEDNAQRRLEVKARSTSMMGIPNEHQLKFNSIKDAKQLLRRDLMNKADIKTMSMDDLYNNLKVTNEEVNTSQAVNIANIVTNANTQVNDAFSSNIDNLSDTVICAFLASQPNSPQLAHENMEQIHPDDLEEMDLRWQMAILTMRAIKFLKKTGRKLTINGNETIGFDKCNVEFYNYHKRRYFAKECRALRNQNTKHKESTRRNVPMETPASIALVSCDETVNLLKSQNEKLLKDSKKSELMVLIYKSGLKSVEERLEFFKKNESIYLEDIKVLKVKIQMKEIAITELRRKLEIVENCKKRLGYESYNVVPPPYTGNFMPPKPDLSYTDLDEFVDKPVAENTKSCKEDTKAVRKNSNSLIIKELMSDDEDENATQPKIVKKTVKPSIV